MQRVVGVKLGNSNKVYTFLANSIEDLQGKDVVVESSLGQSYGKVVTDYKEVEDSDDLKPVLRVATDRDRERFLDLEKKAQKDMQVVKDKVKKLGLAMKIVSCQYTLDGSKIIVEFSAEERVDFRELLKELASALHVRIELHQVGQRDEVKVKGGIGPCGQICCCTRFLNDFEHVTVKMAKNQGLSLSPTKISGLCGRLMCCLAYENKTYEEALKKMPKVNSQVQTPKGQGTVVYNDILRERVSVKIFSGDESFTVYDFDLAELGKAEPKAKAEAEKQKPAQAKEHGEAPKQKPEPKGAEEQEPVVAKEGDAAKHKSGNRKKFRFSPKKKNKGDKNGIQDNK